MEIPISPRQTWLALLLLILPATRGAGQGRPVDPGDPGFPVPRPTPGVWTNQASSMALGPSDRTLYVAGGPTQTLTAFRVGGGDFSRLWQLALPGEPTQLALAPDGQTLFASLRTAGQVAVIDLAGPRIRTRIPVGVEPTGVVLDRAGARLYVSNFMSGTVSVLDTTRLTVRTIDLGPTSFPYALAAGLPRVGAEQDIVVAHFFSPAPPDRRPGLDGEADDGRRGRVTLISARENRVRAVVDLSPIPTGFTSDRRAFGGDAASPTLGFPNLLNAVAVRDRFAYITHVGASPRGPVHFTTNTQAFVHVVDTVNTTESFDAHINLNAAVLRERPRGFFFNTPWSMAFAPDTNWGYVLSAASDLAMRIAVDSQGFPSIEGNHRSTSRAGIVRVAVGKNPRSVLLRSDGRLAFVHNHVSRDVSVIDTEADAVIATLALEEPPPPGSLAASIRRGEELFNTSRGTSSEDPALRNRMSTNGWGSCFSCHPFGWSDGVVWNFASGPRKSPSLAGTFDRRDPADQRVLNHSAIFDEIADFELNIRTVSSDPAADGSTGLILNVPRSDIPPLTPGANSGRSRDWTDIENYIHTIRAPLAPVSPAQAEPGRALFSHLGCVPCHGGPKWTSSRRSFTPPPVPPGVAIEDGQILAVLRDVDTFLAGEVNASNQPARGAAGFNPPSLLGAWVFAPFFHNGQAASLEESLTRVLGARSHGEISAGRPLTPGEVSSLTTFLRSIDDRTPPFPLPGPAR